MDHLDGRAGRSRPPVAPLAHRVDHAPEVESLGGGPVVVAGWVVLVRHPDGIKGKSFFQWNVPEGTPTWIRKGVLRDPDDPNARDKIVFLVDKNGQQIAAMVDMKGLDATSLASLTAGNVAATDGLAKLIGEKEFSILFHEVERDNIHISLVAQRVILVVIFDERSSLGLVRLRVKRASQELERVFEQIVRKAEQEQGNRDRFDSPFAEITDEDIDSLFSE